MTYDPNNIFAKILRGEIPCKKAYEDENVLAFYDIAPKAKVHVLVIPKKGNYLNISDFCERASEEEIALFFKTAMKICTDLNLTSPGFRLITNNGHNGGQEVEHFHIHLLGGEPVGGLVGA